MNIQGIGSNPLAQSISINSNVSTANTKADTVKADEFKKALENARDKKDDKELMKACQQFEEMFTRMMLKSMRRTVMDSGLTENSFARETYQEMLDAEMAKESSKGTGIGIAQKLYDQLKSEK